MNIAECKATGPAGDRFLPFLRRGGARVCMHQEITKLSDGGLQYNFRTIVDDETLAKISI